MKFSDFEPGHEADLKGESVHSYKLLLDALEELSIHQPDLVKVVETLVADNHGVWIVGGCIRDVFSTDGEIDFSNLEVDLAVTSTPREMLELFDEFALSTGADYGTITLRVNGGPNSHGYEATTLRGESGYTDGRRPDSVDFIHSLKGDLSRRDFTINSMAVDPVRGLFYDPHQGLSDLQSGVVKTVGVAKDRLGEDGLRILRAFRYLDTKSGMRHLSPELGDAIRSGLERLSPVSPERIWSEFRRILDGERVGDVLRIMSKYGVLNCIGDSNVLDPCMIGAVEAYSHADDPLPQTGTPLRSIIRLFLLLSNCETEQLRAWARSMRLSNRSLEILQRMHRWVPHPPGPGIEDQRRFSVVTAPHTDMILRVQVALAIVRGDEATSEHLSSLANGELIRPHHHDPLINGRIIMDRTDLEQGKELGQLKSHLYRIQVEQDLCKSSEVLAYLDQLDLNDASSLDSLKWP